MKEGKGVKVLLFAVVEIDVIVIPVEAPESCATGGTAASLVASSHTGVAADLKHKHTRTADIYDVDARGNICVFHNLSCVFACYLIVMLRNVRSYLTTIFFPLLIYMPLGN